MKYLQDTKVQVAIVVIVLLLSLFKTLNNENNLEILKKEGKEVVGEIIGHSVSGLAETYYVKFAYEVENIRYVKSVNYSFKFTDCHKTKDCIGRKFLVYYDVENPKNAFMDFNDEK